jgi:hypothetical protein
MATVLNFKTATHPAENQGAKASDCLPDVNSLSAALIRKQYCRPPRKTDSRYEFRHPTDDEIKCNDYFITHWLTRVQTDA